MTDAGKTHLYGFVVPNSLSFQAWVLYKSTDGMITMGGGGKPIQLCTEALRDFAAIKLLFGPVSNNVPDDVFRARALEPFDSKAVEVFQDLGCAQFRRWHRSGDVWMSGCKLKHWDPKFTRPAVYLKDSVCYICDALSVGMPQSEFDKRFCALEYHIECT